MPAVMSVLHAAVKRLFDIKSYRMKIESEELTVEDDFIFGMVTNSRSVGGFKNITGKNVELDDGLFEVTLIKRPKNAIELNNIMAALIGAKIDNNSMHCFKASHIEIETETEIPWTLDGEFGGNHKSILIRNEKRAINFKISEK